VAYSLLLFCVSHIKHTFFALILWLVCAYSPHAKENSLATPQNANAQAQDRLKSLGSEAERLLTQLSLDEKISLIHANTKFSAASVERLGINEMWISDGPCEVQ
jgi:beta-glucosidase